MLMFALLLQAAPVAERFSILQPVATEKCARVPVDEVLVCADPLPEQALPLPHEAVSSRPQPSNPDMTGIGALRAQRTPCAARTGGCQVGFNILGPGVALVRGVQKLVAPDSCCESGGEATDPLRLVGDAAKGVGRAFAKKRDVSNRVPIRLDEQPSGAVLP